MFNRIKMTKNDILVILNNDSWFRPGQGQKKTTMVDNNGNTIEVSESYYHTFSSKEQIIIRVSDHGTSLQTWVKRRVDPSKSIQNLSVVFSNEPVNSNIKTEPITVFDSKGNPKKTYIYFVVEQYKYRIDSLSKSDFKKFVNCLKSLNDNKVFSDPFRKKPSKKASRTILEPQDENGNPVPASVNNIHARQNIVLKNKNNEIDANGNIITEIITRIVREEVKKYFLNKYKKF